MSRLSPAMTGALAAGICFGLFVTTQWLVVHWLSSSRRARVLFLGYGICVIAFVITVCLLTEARGRLLSTIFGAMTMSCLFVLYTPLYYVVATSLSVQSIVLLLDHHGRLARETLYETFASRRLLQGRLETLARSGYVARDGGAFRITRRGRRVVAPFLVLRSLWNLGPGG